MEEEAEVGAEAKTNDVEKEEEEELAGRRQNKTHA